MADKHSVVYNGRTYCTLVEFAERVHVSLPTVTRYVQNPELAKCLKPIEEGERARYIDWEIGEKVFTRISKKKSKTTPKKKQIKSVNTLMDNKQLGEAKVNELKVIEPNNNLKDLEFNADTIDLSRIDPYAHPDCWELENDDVTPVKDPDGKPKLDYDRLKTKVTVATYQLKLETDKGNLIPKEELIDSIVSTGILVRTVLENIKYKYGESLSAVAESQLKAEFTPEGKVNFLNAFDPIEKEILHDIQVQFEDLKEKYSNASKENK